MSRSLLFPSIVLVLVIKCVRSDEYLNESEGFCKKTRDVLSCGKYTLLKFIDRASTNNVVVTNTSSTVELVKISDPEEDESFFPEARKLSGTDELTRFIKFVQARVDRFLRTQGVSIPLPSGFKVIEETTAVDQARKLKKKKGVISLLTLLGVFKLKLLVGIAVLGIFFIKKVILLSALILPSVLHNLKMSCKHAFSHQVSHGHEEFHDDSIYGNYGHSGYNKEWERRYKNPQAGLPTQDFAG